MVSVTTVKLHSFAVQLASAMAYLEEKRIVHGSLACRHVLIKDDKTVKLSGFATRKELRGSSNKYVSSEVSLIKWKVWHPDY